jgi:hypothetical protein
MAQSFVFEDLYDSRLCWGLIRRKKRVAFRDALAGWWSACLFPADLPRLLTEERGKHDL